MRFGKIGGTIPDRGDIFNLQFKPQSGREQVYRPAFIISPAAYNKVSTLILVCPITSRQKGWPFEVELTPPMKIRGVVLVNQIKSIDCISRGAIFVERSPDDVIDEVLAKLETLVS
ncbi:type II toxin-antitoxin system PemK/MazF family toxin [Acaryochloris sp. CCMEE 5410]|nr:type II toxin-antitoxin system PemK/MazF family toxin [Acaryochloris sp. CCMEE 5410]